MQTLPPPAEPASPRPRRRLYALLAVLLAVAGLGAWRWQELQAARRAAGIAAFDLDAAMDLAGAVVPPTVESFYFFVLDPAAPADESGELADTLVKAAGEHEFLGIAGADMDHNRSVLRRALTRLNARGLEGLVIVYVGPAEHEPELKPLVEATGAELRFVAYRTASEQAL